MKKLLVVLICLFLLVPTVISAPVERLSVGDFTRAVTAQIVCNVDVYRRDLTWYKIEDGQVIPEFKDLDEDDWAYQWLKKGWFVVYGEWNTEPRKGKIMGSGEVLYSWLLPMGINLEGKPAATYVGTNAHVVDVFMLEASRGSRDKPLDLYAEKDTMKTMNMLRTTYKEEAKPIAQYYFDIDNSYITVKTEADQRFRTKVNIVLFDIALDFALLEMENVLGLPYVSFRGTPIQVGETIKICGAPLGFAFSRDEGRVSQVHLNLGTDGVEDYIVWDNQVRMDIAAAPGSSGSAIFDKDGYMIAQLHGIMVHNGNYIQGGQLAVDQEDIIRFLVLNGFSWIVQNPYGIWANAPYNTVRPKVGE